MKDYLTTLTINLDLLHQNVNEILSYKQGDFMFVVKGNAYGHGMRIVPELNQYDKVKYYAVATLNEAQVLSQHSNKPIVILNPLFGESLTLAFQQGFIPIMYDFSTIKDIDYPVQICINVDTGFHRYGNAPTMKYKQEIVSLSSNPNIDIIAIYTHLKLSDDDNDREQIQSFMTFVEDVPFPTSLSDSIAYTRYDTNESIYRIGALLYGLQSKREVDKLSVSPIQMLESTVTRVETLKKDDTVFYYNGIVKKGTTVATIPIGYADGLFRTMPDGCYVLVNGHRCPYLGVGMDNALIDVTGASACIGDTVTICGGEGISLEKLSSLLHTNKNNIIAGIGPRVIRTYTKNNQVIATSDQLLGVHHEVK